MKNEGNMSDKQEKMLALASEIEKVIAEIYRVFSECFEDDRVFWWSLCIEEMNHAASLNTAKRFISVDEDLKEDLFEADEKTLIELKERYTRLLKDISEKSCERIDAFNIALDLENGDVESKFQEFMSKMNPTSQVTKILQKLSEDDIDHVNKIKKYLQENVLNND